MRVKSNAGVFLGEEGTFNLGVSGANAILTNSVDGADISFRINNAGVQLSPLTITNTGTVSLTGAMTVAGVTSSAAVNVTDTEVSTNAQTGAIRTAGGIGVAGQSYFGNTLDVAGNLTTTNIVTAGQGIHDIGSTTNKFANVYATTANITTINATKS